MDLDEATKNTIIEANNLETAIKNAETVYTKLAVFEAECRTDMVQKYFAREKKKIGMSINRLTDELRQLKN